MKYMKDVIRPDSHRLYKTEYLNRPVKHEERRRKIFKQLRDKGMRPYEAYQLSLKRMVIK
tara:strand:+ start:1269 stop:1448 length:180 start_codon:yes stop_codon:yes gene_type:complete